MVKLSKRLQNAEKKHDLTRTYSIQDAIAILKDVAPLKFDQTMELSLSLGIDTKKADQQVRGTVNLPHGTGKTARVVVFASGDKAADATRAGADFVGSDDLAEKIMEGWVDFDAVVATPDMMRVLGKLGKVLGPRGLMPSPKAGTVTQDVGRAVKEIKAGKIEVKADKFGNVNTVFGKLSFREKELQENYEALLASILK